MSVFGTDNTCRRDGKQFWRSKGCPADHGEGRAEAARGELVGRLDGTESVADGGLRKARAALHPRWHLRDPDSCLRHP